MRKAENKKILTPGKALSLAQKYCSYQERCQQEVRNKLYRLNIAKEIIEGIIAELIIDNFINEERFSKEYVNGKFKIKRWGKNKIIFELKHRNISDYCIRKGLEEIDKDEYINVLKQVINKKAKIIKETEKFIVNQKVAKYAISRGFEQELIWQILKIEE